MKVYYRKYSIVIEVKGVDDVTIVGNNVYITAGDRDIKIKTKQLVGIMGDEEETIA